MSEKLSKLLLSVDVVLERESRTRVDGKVSSFRTQRLSKQIMYETCRRLHRLGYYMESIDSISPKHITALVKSWRDDGLSNKTIQNQFSRVKIFVNKWIGKRGLVRDGVASYLPDVDPNELRVRTYAEKSKSWSGNGLDVSEWLSKAENLDERFHCMLFMGLAFGLRKKEMLMIKPWRADKGVTLEIDGSVAKNGRYRSIKIDGEYGQFQRQVLELVKRVVKRSETLGWPNRTLKQNENRYYKMMSAIGATKYESGVTGHGLRAEFAENQALIMGLIPPALGGDKKQMTKREREVVTLKVSNEMGHGRVSVIGAYYGAFRKVQAIPRSLGERAGTFVVSEDDVGHIYCNPPLHRDAAGAYRKLSEDEKQSIQLMVRLEGPNIQDGNKELDMSALALDSAMSEAAHERFKKLLIRIGF
jgi:hypothetical protein